MKELIERIEAAGGPDRNIDLLIDLIARPDQWAQVHHDNPSNVPTQWCDDDELPRYTASIDAAMTLVPEGAGWRIEHHPGLIRKHYASVWLHSDADEGDGWFKGSSRSTPALALCAAALRAKQDGGGR